MASNGDARIVVPVTSVTPIDMRHIADRNGKMRATPKGMFSAADMKYGEAGLWFKAPGDLPALGATPRRGAPGYVLYRRQRDGIWRPSAFSLTDKRVPGREVGVKSFWKPFSDGFTYEFMTNTRTMTPELISLVTHHSCASLLATIVVRRSLTDVPNLILKRISIAKDSTSGRPCVDAKKFERT
jgi:hypothetical protein